VTKKRLASIGIDNRILSFPPADVLDQILLLLLMPQPTPFPLLPRVRIKGWSSELELPHSVLLLRSGDRDWD